MTPAARSRIQASYAALPLAFEQNQGQTDAQVKYVARGNGYTLFLTANDAVFSLRARPAASESPAVPRMPEFRAKSLAPRHNAREDSTAVVRMHLAGGNSLAKVEGSDPVPGTANYFLGNDPSKWRSGVVRYARVSYQNVYPGVAMAFHGAERELEFDFVVAPGASPAPIGFQFTGNQGTKTDDSGNLIISSAAGDVLLHKPVAYQEQNGARQPVDARFVLKAHNRVNFDLGNYDHSRELVIDPSVSYAYSTYLGGTGDDKGNGIAFDNNGNAYVTGETASINFPGASNTLTGTANVFVTKIKADGSGLTYSTYVGGNVSDSGNGIAVDASGNAFVAGGTQSSTFPTTAGAFQTVLKGSESAFIFKLNTSGALAYSTFLGGTGADLALGMALDSSGNVYAVGRTSSTDFPLSLLTPPLQATPAGGFVTKLKPAGGGASDLQFSTYLGGSTNDFASAVAVATGSSPSVYVTGSASSVSFTTTAGVIQPAYGGGSSDAFVTVINSTGSAPAVYSTFLGGSDTDTGFGIAVDSSGNAYVTGQTASGTTSTKPFPLKSPALQSKFGGGTFDAFVTELNPTGTILVYSTYLGGSGADISTSIALDGLNNAYVTGQTASSDFPTVIPTQLNPGGGNDAFVSEINPAGSALVFSTYLGGSMDEDDLGKLGAIAVDNTGTNIYVTGNTLSQNFPTWPSPPYQSNNAGGTDAFAVKYTQATAAPSFGLSATALSPATVSPGGSATSTVSVTPPNGFGGTVTLTCSVSPTVTLGPTCGGATATTAAPATLTVRTTAATALLRDPKNNRSSGWLYAMLLPIAGMALLGFGLGSAGSQRKKLLGSLLIGLLLSGLMLMPACGGGSSSKNNGNPGTPAGTYTITISGTATGATQTGTSPSLTLIVN